MKNETNISYVCDCCGEPLEVYHEELSDGEIEVRIVPCQACLAAERDRGREDYDYEA